ncbi:MAG TPA: outer membrane beta-barrel protein [Spongiibacteraceae bacterium]|nr:outer membrane beta-barrel protein [Spongiibacteraceae bacterium]
MATIAMSATAMADGFYAVGEVTHADNSLDRDYFDNALHSAGVTDLTSKDSGTTNRWRLQGGYRFNENLSIEAGYIDFGSVDYKADIAGGSAKGSVKAGGMDLAGLVWLPLNEQISLFAKAGAVAAKVKSKLSASTSVPLLDESASTNVVRPLLGVGAVYRIAPNWDLRADYDQVANLGKSHDTGTLTSRMFSLGVVYTF